MNTSISTSAGLRTRLLKNSRPTGTVIDEKPYPRAPLTMAAPSPLETDYLAKRAAL